MVNWNAEKIKENEARYNLMKNSENEIQPSATFKSKSKRCWAQSNN